MDLMTIASIGMQNDLLRLEGISQNLANVLTPGYKRQVTTGASFQVQLNTALGQPQALALSGASAKAAHVSLDTSMGALKYTGSKQDVAIEGDSFFEVVSPNGLAYTRQGSMHVDVFGRLVSAAGLPLMGVGGEITLTGAPFSIAANGDVQQGDRIAGRLKRVKFENASDLVPLGNGIYDAGNAKMLDKQSTEPLRVGFQENSNVSSPQEMVRLTETVRHFESLQKIVQGYDDSLEKVIRKLGEF